MTGVIEHELLRMQRRGQASRRGGGVKGCLGSWGEQGLVFCDPAFEHKIENRPSTEEINCNCEVIISIYIYSYNSWLWGPQKLTNIYTLEK